MYMIEIGIICFVLGFLFGLWYKHKKAKLTAEATQWDLPEYLRFVEENEFPDTFCEDCGSNLVTFKSRGRVVFCYYCNMERLNNDK